MSSSKGALPYIEPESSPTSGSAELSGRRFAHFDVIGEIGRGGMGVVYEACDTKLGRLVALKIIPAMPADSEVARRISKEALAASSLRHPYICHVFDVLQDDGLEIIVMERLQGEDLRARLDRGEMPLHDVLAIVAEVAEALRDTHAHGLLHRDIKPSNLFITLSGHVKLLDFGVARRLEVKHDDVTTARRRRSSGAATFDTVGTIGYMAPEQAAGEKLDERADLFALGVVLYEMLAGKPAFSARNVLTYLHAVYAEQPPALSTVRGDIPDKLSDLVSELLSSDRAERPATTAQVYARLIDIASNVSGRVMTVQRLRQSQAIPPTKYVRSEGASIAYQTFGTGDVDLVQLAGWVSHLDLMWYEPRVAKTLRRLAAGRRLIRFDKRGFGLSDRVSETTTLEQRADDVVRVLDTVESKRAVILGLSEGAAVAAQFAVMHPERTRALVLYAPFARRLWAHDYPWAPTAEMRERWLAYVEANWGGAVDLDRVAPSLKRDAAFREWYASYLRHSASPATALELVKASANIDIRRHLPNITAPTLIIHRTGDQFVNVEEGRYIAERIPNAKFVELPGDDHLLYAGNVGLIMDEIDRFLAEV